MSKGNLLGRLFGGRDIKEYKYVFREECDICNPEPLADEETEQTIKEYLEENPVDLEQVEKENMERKMKDILESKAFPNNDIEVTYDSEEGSYTFKAVYKHNIKEYLEENPVQLGQLEKENVDCNMKDILESTAFPHNDVEVTYDSVEDSYTFKIGYKHTTPENEEVGELYLPKKLKDESKEMVEHPDHYNRTSVETMEKFFLMTAGNDDMVKGALLFNILKYTDRAGHKGDIEVDNKKAEFYLDLLNHLFPHDFDRYRIYQSFKKKK